MWRCSASITAGRTRARVNGGRATRPVTWTLSSRSTLTAKDSSRDTAPHPLVHPRVPDEIILRREEVPTLRHVSPESGAVFSGKDQALARLLDDLGVPIDATKRGRDGRAEGGRPRAAYNRRAGRSGTAKDTPVSGSRIPGTVFQGTASGGSSRVEPSAHVEPTKAVPGTTRNRFPGLVVPVFPPRGGTGAKTDNSPTEAQLDTPRG